MKLSELPIIGDFWRPQSGPYSRPLEPFDDETLAVAQQRLGVTLPQLLVELLRIQNGGCTNYSDIHCQQPTLWGDTIVTLQRIGGISRECVWFESLEPFERDFEYGSPEIEAEVGHRVGAAHLLVPLFRDAHTMVALDYRKCPDSNDPPIIWMTFDEGCEFVQIAPNFETLLKSLGKPFDEF